MTSSEDEELVKALKYVLQISVQKGTLYTSSLSNHVFTLIIAKIYLLILACFPFIYQGVFPYIAKDIAFLEIQENHVCLICLYLIFKFQYIVN